MTTRKTQSNAKTTPSDRSIIIALAWAEPDKPPQGSMSETKNPFLIRKVAAVPRVGDPLSFELPSFEQSAPIIIPQPLTTAHGRVVSVREVNQVQGHPAFLVTIQREGRVGMNWSDLGFCIGAEMVGFNDFVGRVEGPLIGLLPNAELAVLHVPALTKFYLREYENSLKENPDVERDEDALAEIRDDGPAVWVPWAGLWTKQGLEIMHGAAPQRSTRKRKSD